MFQDEDEAYASWLATNGTGYVLNAYRKPTSDYLMLHRVSCGHLHRKDDRQLKLTGDFIKICSTSVDDLQRWAELHVDPNARLDPCQVCKP
jgi:hypothetical protein